MQLNPHFNFNGNCAEAMAFYAKALNGRLEYQMTWGESPMSDQVPENFQDKIMHSSVNLGENVIMGADAPPGRFQSASGVVTSITAATVKTASACSICWRRAAPCRCRTPKHSGPKDLAWQRTGSASRGW